MSEQRLHETEDFIHEMRSSDIVTHHETKITSSTSQSGTKVTTRVTTVTKMTGNKKVQQQEVKVVKHKGSTTTQLFRQSKMSLRHFLDHRSEWCSMSNDPVKHVRCELYVSICRVRIESFPDSFNICSVIDYCFITKPYCNGCGDYFALV